MVNTDNYFLLIQKHMYLLVYCEQLVESMTKLSDFSVLCFLLCSFIHAILVPMPKSDHTDECFIEQIQYPLKSLAKTVHMG